MLIDKILGLTLREAKEIIEHEGKYIYSVHVTSPPRERTNEYEDYYRVLNVKELDESNIKLIVCKPL
ncbi:UNVERIFIED_CONTAM: hypothetical protein Cloal_4075 [Acetivibrio alkalicellulosi]